MSEREKKRESESVRERERDERMDSCVADNQAVCSAERRGKQKYKSVFRDSVEADNKRTPLAGNVCGIEIMKVRVGRQV